MGRTGVIKHFFIVGHSYFVGNRYSKENDVILFDRNGVLAGIQGKVGNYQISLKPNFSKGRNIFYPTVTRARKKITIGQMIDGPRISALFKVV